MVNPYDLQPEPKWYHTLWEMRNKEFRNWFLKTKKRELRMYMKYQSHQVYERAFFAFLLTSVAVYVCGTDFANALIRWPTEDVNELLKQPVWQKRKNEISDRQEMHNKFLEDSNYTQRKNDIS